MAWALSAEEHLYALEIWRAPDFSCRPARVRLAIEDGPLLSFKQSESSGLVETMRGTEDRLSRAQTFQAWADTIKATITAAAIVAAGLWTAFSLEAKLRNMEASQSTASRFVPEVKLQADVLPGGILKVSATIANMGWEEFQFISCTGESTPTPMNGEKAKAPRPFSLTELSFEGARACTGGDAEPGKLRQHSADTSWQKAFLGNGVIANSRVPPGARYRLESAFKVKKNALYLLSLCGECRQVGDPSKGVETYEVGRDEESKRNCSAPLVVSTCAKGDLRSAVRR